VVNTVGTGDPAHHALGQRDIVVMAFVPTGTSIASMGNPPPLQYPARTLGYEVPQPARFAPAARPRAAQVQRASSAVSTRIPTSIEAPASVS
jgi:hypothetical protein